MPRTAAVDYTLAVVITATALVVRHLFTPVIGGTMPFFTLFLAIAASAWRGGNGPGAVALVVGGVGSVGLLNSLPASPSPAVSMPAQLFFYSLTGIVLIAMFHAMRQTHRHAEEQQRAFRTELAVRQRAEQELRAAELRFRASQEASLIGFAILQAIRDSAGRVSDFQVEYVNPAAARLFRRPMSKLTGRRLTAILPSPEVLKDLLARYVPVVESGAHYDAEIPLTVSGSPGWYRMMAVKLGDGIAVSFTDVTEQHRQQDRLRASEASYRQLADALQEADQRKNEFIATLAHELRNPLAPLRNSLQLLQLAHHQPEQTAECLAMMDRQLEHMVRLIDDLLDVSRISRGKVTLRKEQIDLGTIIQHAVETSRPVIDEVHHELVMHLPEEPILIEADPIRLAQVFSNLLNNSAKYTEPGGRIELCVALTPGWAAVHVKDNGCGIPPAMLPRIFDLFTQVDRTLSRAQGGLGIGLSLAQSLVKMHSGTIEAHSSGPQQGAEFIVRLPRLEVPGTRQALHPGQANAVPAPHTPLTSGTSAARPNSESSGQNHLPPHLLPIRERNR